MDVGRGSGSCSTDCDCPCCSPYCSRSGYCQNNEANGNRPCTNDDDDEWSEEDLPWFWTRSPYEIFQYAMKRMVMEDNWNRV